MAFEGVSIDIMHNVLIVTSGLTQKVLLQKNLKFSNNQELDVFVKELEKKKHGLIKTQKKPCHKCGNIRHEWDLIMLKLLLVREIKNEKQTHGLLFKIGKDDKREFICYTLEDKERDVKIKAKQQYQQANILLLSQCRQNSKRTTFNFECA